MREKVAQAVSTGPSTYGFRSKRNRKVAAGLINGSRLKVGPVGTSTEPCRGKPDQ